MTKKMSLKSIEVDSFVTGFDHDKTRAQQGGITGPYLCYPTGEMVCWTQNPWCVTTVPR